jgi:hypothetical protein
VNAPNGTVINFSIVSGPGSFVGPNTCTTTNGSCTATITSAVNGVTTVKASTSVAAGGAPGGTILLSRSTGDNLHNDGPNAQKTWADVRITITPDATNEVGVPHTFTVTVEQKDVDGFAPVQDAPVTVTLTGSNGANPDPAGPVMDNTDSNGQVKVTFTSQTAGQVTGHACADLTIGQIPVTTCTDGTGNNSGDAVKTYVDANISIAPLDATDPTGDHHTLTATVQVDDGSGAGLVPAGDDETINFSIVSGPGHFIDDIDSCLTTGGTGACSVQITSDEGGTTVVQATTTVNVGGVALTRTTGDGVHGDSDNAQKHWVPPTTTTTIAPLGSTTTTTIAPTTTTVAPALPFTGGNASGLLRVAFWLLIIGGAMLAVRQSRVRQLRQRRRS